MKLLRILYQKLKHKLRSKVSQGKSLSSKESTGQDIYGSQNQMSESDGSDSLIEYGSVKVCDSIYTLLMKKFVKIVVENDISQLIISGSPSPEALEAAKVSVISQYHEACPNPISKQHLTTIKKIEAHKTKIVRVLTIVGALRESYSEALIEQLRDDKYNYPFTHESLLADLDKVEESLRGDLHKLTKAQADLKIQDEKSAKGAKKHTMLDYITSIHRYNSAFGTKYNLQDENLFVIDYCSMMNELREHYRTLTPEYANG